MSDTKACPFCGKEIKSIALKCKHCGKSLLDEASPEEISTNLFWDGMGGDSSRLTSSPTADRSADPEEQIKISLEDKYDIIEEVGRGGMAIIYKAMQKNLNREVALKVLPKNFVHDQEYLIRFHREAREVAKLSHTNIVTIFDEGEKDGIHYLAMEFLDGKDLQEIIREANKISVDRTVEIISAIADALDYVHRRGLVHRDIKSSNIFLLKDGRAVLTDFGIARTADKTKLTQAGTVMGTPDYMSPEQAEGDAVDGRSDIYGLGIVMYECLTGTVPFKADNPLSLIRKIIDEKPASPKEVNSQIPKWLNDIIMKTLEKDPDNRILTGANLAQSLREQKVIAGDIKEYKSEKAAQTKAVKLSQKKSKEKSKDDLTQYVSARTTRTKKAGSKASRFIFLFVFLAAAAAAYYFLVMEKVELPFTDKIPSLESKEPADAAGDETSSTETGESDLPVAAVPDSTIKDSSVQLREDSTQVPVRVTSDTSSEKEALPVAAKSDAPVKKISEPVKEAPVKKEPAKEKPVIVKEEPPKKVEDSKEDLEQARKKQIALRIRQLESELEKAKEVEADTKKKYDHAKKMREKNLLSPADLSFAQLEYESAKANVEELEISIKVLKKQAVN